MKATFIDNFGKKVVIEPVRKKTRDELEKFAKKVMRKRNITSELKIYEND